MQSVEITAGAASMCSQSSTRPILLPIRATRCLIFSTSVNITLTVITEPTTPNAPTVPRLESPPPDTTPHEDFDVDIIWENMDIRSDFRSMRKSSRGPIGRILVDFGKVLESGMFEVISVNASKHMFCAVVACQKNRDEGVDDLLWTVL